MVIPQYSRSKIIGIWLAAALPMGLLSWVVAPRLADSFSGPHPLIQALLLGWVVVPLLVASAAEQLIPLTPPVARDFSLFLGSHAGHTFFHGAWGWFAVMLTLGIFNTVLGEELLFRGFLLPRMNGAFGRWDWVVNGVLFGLYHVHVPWSMPGALLDTFVLAYPSKRYQSVWVGIVVHSGQTVFVTLAVLALVV